MRKREKEREADIASKEESWCAGGQERGREKRGRETERKRGGEEKRKRGRDVGTTDARTPALTRTPTRLTPDTRTYP